MGWTCYSWQSDSYVKRTFFNLTGNKGFNRYSWVCLISWFFFRIRQRSRWRTKLYDKTNNFNFIILIADTRLDICFSELDGFDGNVHIVVTIIPSPYSRMWHNELILHLVCSYTCYMFNPINAECVAWDIYFPKHLRSLRVFVEFVLIFFQISKLCSANSLLFCFCQLVFTLCVWLSL